MERKITTDLLKWKMNPDKKPIILYGISGCGKTHTTLEFAKKEYKNMIYFDCVNNLELDYVFDKNNTLDKLIRALSALSLETIFKDDTLIIFDNVSEKVLNAIKNYFTNENYHVIMITNSLDFIHANKTDKVILKKMSLVTFPEYLKYTGKEQLIDFIEDSFKTNKPMPFHSLAMEEYNDYLFTGGYPSAIINFKQINDYNTLNLYHDKNIKLLKYRLLELDSLIDIKRGIEVFDNMTLQLLKPNKKFQYGLLRTGARAKEYNEVINFMEKNNLIIKSYRISTLKSPLSTNKDLDSFKLYYNDTALLYKNMNVNINRLINNEKLLDVLYENSIVISLYNNGLNMYYYHSEGKSSVDIIVQTRNGKIIPIEILHGKNNNKSKSMPLAMNKYNLDLGIRFGSDNFYIKNNIKYLPYYAAFCIGESL